MAYSSLLTNNTRAQIIGAYGTWIKRQPGNVLAACLYGEERAGHGIEQDIKGHAYMTEFYLKCGIPIDDSKAKEGFLRDALGICQDSTLQGLESTLLDLWSVFSRDMGEIPSRLMDEPAYK